MLNWICQASGSNYQESTKHGLLRKFSKSSGYPMHQIATNPTVACPTACFWVRSWFVLRWMSFKSPLQHKTCNGHIPKHLIKKVWLVTKLRNWFTTVAGSTMGSVRSVFKYLGQQEKHNQMLPQQQTFFPSGIIKEKSCQNIHLKHTFACACVMWLAGEFTHW